MQVTSWLERTDRIRPALVAILAVAGCLIVPASAAAEATIRTTTAITCASRLPIRLVGEGVVCNVRVRNIGTSAPVPTGTVKLAAEGGQISATCTSLLLPLGAEGICVGTYHAQRGGTQTITANYVGDATHLPSAGATTVAVSETATTINCSPEHFAVTEGATCSAEVHNTGGASGNLSGTLSFELPRGGKLEPGSCNVAESNPCTLKFSAELGDFYIINATYSGDSTHPGSKGQELLFAREPSATSVECGSAVHFPGGKVECEVRVNGFHSEPNHGDTLMRFTAEGREVASCDLLVLGQSENEGFCHASFTVHEAGTQAVAVDYPGDVVHLPSGGHTSVIVSDTTTSVKCQTDSLAVGESSLCAAEVTNTGGAPDGLSGTVSFESDQSGRFEPDSCDMSKRNVCTVEYFPEVGGKHVVTARYTGDPTHPASASEPVSLAVLGTSVQVVCVSEFPVLPEVANCLASVRNEGIGSKGLSGTVRFDSNNFGSFNTEQCTLVPFPDEDGGFCFVRYTIENSGTHTIRASYSGDETHPPAIDGEFQLESQRPATSMKFGCIGSPRMGEHTSCFLRLRNESATAVTPPAGEVLFSPNRKAPGHEEFAPCKLEPVNSTESECTTAYEPFTGDSQLLTARYAGNEDHGPAAASLRPIHLTTTEVDCGGTAVLGTVTTCIATVRDNEGDREPKGVVQFTGSAVGEFSSPECKLKGSVGLPAGTTSCSVTFKPLAETTIAITATYGGDTEGSVGPSHAPSVGSIKLEVRPH